MKSDAQIIQEMTEVDVAKQREGKLNRYNALVVVSTQVQKGKASSKGGLITFKTDAAMVGEVSHGDRIPIVYFIDKEEYNRRRALGGN